MLLYAYGAYKHSISPSFSASRFCLVDRGITFAIAHVRGGGCLGDVWHEEGKKKLKKNTFLDYIACANHLIDQKYTYKGCERTSQMMNKFSQIRFNRYGKGQIMRQHHDHIHSLFDGKEKGIPVLSFILNLNDNYRGADLFFWEDHAVHLGKGDIIMFPSLFLFPHGVTEAREGKRYSAVSWAW